MLVSLVMMRVWIGISSKIFDNKAIFSVVLGIISGGIFFAVLILVGILSTAVRNNILWDICRGI